MRIKNSFLKTVIPLTLLHFRVSNRPIIGPAGQESSDQYRNVPKSLM